MGTICPERSPPICITPRVNCSTIRALPSSSILSAGARHRGEHGDLQRGKSNSVSAAAVSICRPADDDAGNAEQRIAPAPDLCYISRVGGGEPHLRRNGSDEAVAAHHDRRGRTGAIRGSTRERGLLPRARCFALDGTRLQAPDDRFRGPNVAVLSNRLWRRRFAGDSTILGKQVTLDDTLFTVIGVMPSSFENVLAPAAELWAPLQYDPSLPVEGREWGHHLRMVGRLRPDVTAAHADNELKAILSSLAQTYAKGYDCCGGAPDRMVVNRLQDEITRGVKPSLLAVLGAVILVLLIACVSVTNLLLARSARRSSEFALRAALGADECV